MRQSKPNQHSLQIGSKDYGVIILTALTALIHLFLSFQFSGGPDLIFLLNGLGYFVLLFALYSSNTKAIEYRIYTRWILLGYTALTVILWFLFGARTTLAYVDKLIEVTLIVLLWLENQRTISTASGHKSVA